MVMKSTPAITHLRSGGDHSAYFEELPPSVQCMHQRSTNVDHPRLRNRSDGTELDPRICYTDTPVSQKSLWRQPRYWASSWRQESLRSGAYAPTADLSPGETPNSLTEV